ncbi:MAG: hypothetical protein ACE37H_11310 [Phycisphaeraceae bacterium]
MARYLLSLIVLLPLHSILRLSGVKAMVMAVSLLTAIAAFSSILAVRWISTSWATEPSIIHLALPCGFVAFMFLSRLAASMRPGGSDPAIYNEEWKLDPNASDEQNLLLKARLERQIKLFSLMAVTVGFVTAILV